VNGEIWQAESDSKIHKGDKVKIIDMSGLTLRVEKVLR
jgi:membrane-bound ClpP family serine protease